LSGGGHGATPGGLRTCFARALSSTAGVPRSLVAYGSARAGPSHPSPKECVELLARRSGRGPGAMLSTASQQRRLDGPPPPQGLTDSAGHWDIPLLDRLGVSERADFYLCGPPAFLRHPYRRHEELGGRTRPDLRGRSWAGVPLRVRITPWDRGRLRPDLPAHLPLENFRPPARRFRSRAGAG